MTTSAGTSIRQIEENKGTAKGLRIGLGLIVAAVGLTAVATFLTAPVEVGAVWRLTDMPVIRLLMRLIEGVN